jgi:hypothetical protein
MALGGVWSDESTHWIVPEVRFFISSRSTVTDCVLSQEAARALFSWAQYGFELQNFPVLRPLEEELRDRVKQEQEQVKAERVSAHALFRPERVISSFSRKWRLPTPLWSTKGCDRDSSTWASN